MATYLKYNRYQNSGNKELSTRVKLLIEESIDTIKRFLSVSKKPIIAFSGGKDSIVCAHLACKLRKFDSISEDSFMFEKSKKEAKEIGAFLGLNMSFNTQLSWDWLKEHQEYCTPPMKLQSKLYAMRQQKSVKTFANKKGYDGVLYGRRTQENSVKAPIYTVKGGQIQCHPLFNWKIEDIWEYIHFFKIPYPSLYEHEIGRKEGFTPFLLPPEHFENVWEAIYDYDKEVVLQFAKFHEPAKKFLNSIYGK